MAEYGERPELFEVRTTADGRITGTRLSAGPDGSTRSVEFVVNERGAGHARPPGEPGDRSAVVPATLEVTSPSRMRFVLDRGSRAIVFRRVDPSAAAAHVAKAQQAATPSEQDVVQRARKSTVMVVTEHGSLGSGFVVAGGLIVTNLHVVAGATTVVVRYPTGTEHLVQDVRGFDPANDLAILNVGVDHPALQLSTSVKSPEPGTRVVVVGNPQGLEGTASAGIVSASRKHPTLDLERLQIDAPVSPGSSGGPVLDAVGRVIAVVRATDTGGQNLNFAVPVRYVNRLLRTRAGAISMGRFAAATSRAAGPAAPPAPSRTGRPLFPKSIAGFSLGASFVDATAACGLPLAGKPDFAVCTAPPVPLAFATGEVALTFTAGELTRVMFQGTSRSEVQSALRAKYGEPDHLFSLVKGAWVTSRSWAPEQPGMEMWVLEGGRILAVSHKGGPEISVWYFSDREAEIREQNY